MLEPATKGSLWVLGAVLGCVAAASHGRFANDFVHDDRPMLAGGLIHDPSRIPEVFASHALLAHGPSPNLPLDTYRPVSILSFFWDAWISGRDPSSYHLTNLVLHLACVSLVFAWARLAVPQATALVSGAAALFFGCSPQLVEAHVWINGRSDPLTTVFGLSALLVWRRSVVASGPGRRLYWLLTCVLFLLGLLCKETLLFTLPALVLWPSSQPGPGFARLRHSAPFTVACAIYVGLRVWALDGMRASRDNDQLRQAAAHLPILWLDGLRELFAPERLYLRCLREEYSPLGVTQRLPLLALVLAMAALLWTVRRRLPWLAWGALWFALSLLPAAMISAIQWPGFGRFLYLPCAGLAVGLTEALAACELTLRTRFRAPLSNWLRAVMLVATGGTMAAFATKVAAYTRDYRDERSLYAAALRQAPESASAHARMAALLAHEGKVGEALRMYERAIALDPHEPSFALSSIFFHLSAGHPMDAARLARNAIAHVAAHQREAFRALLIRATAERQPNVAVAELCTCLSDDAQAPNCLAAAAWMARAGGARANELRNALANFGQLCHSEGARRGLSATLRRVQGVP